MFGVLVFLEDSIEVSEINVTVHSGLAAVKDHQDEDELGELVICPVLLFVEILKDAVNKQVLLFFLVHYRIIRDLYANVLENVEAHLQQRFEVLVSPQDHQFFSLIFFGFSLIWWRVFIRLVFASKLFNSVPGSLDQAPDMLKDLWESGDKVWLTHNLYKLEKSLVALLPDVVRVNGYIGVSLTLDSAPIFAVQILLRSIVQVIVVELNRNFLSKRFARHS